MLPKKLQEKLDKRQAENALRVLPASKDLIDLSSNDYLGFGTNTAFAKAIKSQATTILKEQQTTANGATGSRLLTGNHNLYPLAEARIARFHNSDTALIFNSGYDANIGFFQSVPQRGDLIIYDEFIHASIRDGIQMSNARGYKFKHNNLQDLEKVILRLQEMHHTERSSSVSEMYIVTESVFSMDGDSPDLIGIRDIARKHGAHLVVDEAHAIGVLGTSGHGLVQTLNIQKDVFARIITFGKALGVHGAAILGTDALKNYLVNYARSLIYTTALPPHSVAMILSAYTLLGALTKERQQSQPVHELRIRIDHFNTKVSALELQEHIIASDSAIHCAVVSGNEKVRSLSQKFEQLGFNVKPILSPTVPKGHERLRFCLHSFNTKAEITQVLSVLKQNL